MTIAEMEGGDAMATEITEAATEMATEAERTDGDVEAAAAALASTIVRDRTAPREDVRD